MNTIKDRLYSGMNRWMFRPCQGLALKGSRARPLYDNVIQDSRCFMGRKSRPITVTLGELQEQVEVRVKSGAYASSSEVLRAALRALEREEAAVSDWLRKRVEEAFADDRPNIPARTVFTRLRRYHARRAKAAR
ncbi:MAG TPA: type II toxin-antitoxin system ParD family antitoxin [Micropepsaceae bacterium]|nr:type II toxin-antitoxin system ParD family antitoxin [Micropepsaceae bacterium]